MRLYCTTCSEPSEIPNHAAWPQRCPVCLAVSPVWISERPPPTTPPALWAPPREASNQDTERP